MQKNSCSSNNSPIASQRSVHWRECHRQMRLKQTFLSQILGRILLYSRQPHTALETAKLHFLSRSLPRGPIFAHASRSLCALLLCNWHQRGGSSFRSKSTAPQPTQSVQWHGYRLVICEILLWPTNVQVTWVSTAHSGTLHSSAREVAVSCRTVAYDSLFLFNQQLAVFWSPVSLLNVKQCLCSSIRSIINCWKRLYAQSKHRAADFLAECKANNCKSAEDAQLHRLKFTK